MSVRFLAPLLIVAALVLAEVGARGRLAALAPPDRAPRGETWSHRGVRGPGGASGNSLEAFDLARERGFPGLELDVHFLGERGFLVSHDAPVPDGAPTLDEVFSRYGPAFSYWLDFKNLSNDNASAAAAELGRLSGHHRLRDRILVESRNAAALAAFRRALPGVKVVHWIAWYSPKPWHLLHRARTRWRVAWYGFENVSAPLHIVGPGFLADFAAQGVHVFTVNDLERIQQLRDAGVRVILTDLERPPERKKQRD